MKFDYVPFFIRFLTRVFLSSLSDPKIKLSVNREVKSDLRWSLCVTEDQEKYPESIKREGGER